MRDWLLLIAAFLFWPGCRSQNACEEPEDIDFGEIVSTEKAKYLENDQLQYKCNLGYVLEGPEWIRCKGQKWTPRPPKCLAPCRITRQQLTTKNLFVFGSQRKAQLIQSNHSLQFLCNEGYVLVVPSVRKCVDGYIELPLCISEITCNSPRISNGSFRPQRTVYHDGDLIRIRCDSGFTFEPDNGEQVVECTKNGWSPSPKCVKKSCGRAPEIPNASLQQEDREQYDSGKIINYTCNRGFDTKEPAKKTCRRGEWVGSFTCKDVRCSPPEIEHGWITGVRKAKYFPGEKVQYRCNTGYVVLGNSFITCSKEGWTEIPRCTVIEGRCGRPPPVENGDVVDSPKLFYLHSESVFYQCQNYYTILGSPRVTCQHGRWSERPTCRAACTASEEEMKQRNIRLRWTNGDKLYSTNENVVEFVCLRGYELHPSSGPLRLACVEGKFDYPYCIRSN